LIIVILLSDCRCVLLRSPAGQGGRHPRTRTVDICRDPAQLWTISSQDKPAGAQLRAAAIGSGRPSAS
jgi:hypothetical protein